MPFFTPVYIFKNTSFMGALVRKSVDQTGADYNDDVAITWDQEAYDIGGWHSGSNSFLTVPLGVTRVRVAGGIISQNVTSSNITLLYIGKNGSPWPAFDGVPAQRGVQGATGVCMAICSPVLDVTPGDTFELIYEANDTSCDITATRSWLSIERVRNDFSGAMVIKSSDQTADFTAGVVIAYDTEVYDVGGWFDGGTPNRVTVPSGVTYVRVTASMRVTNVDVGSRFHLGLIRKNGSVTAFLPAMFNEGGINAFPGRINLVTAVMPVTAGDYFEHIAQIEGDTSVTVAGTGTSLAIEAVDAATFSGALVTKAANQTTANYSAGAVIAWDDEGGGGYDVGGWHDTVTLNSRLTVPAGVTRVRVRGQVQVSSITSGDVLTLTILKGGTADFDGGAAQRTTPTITSNAINVMTGVLEVVAGNYFELHLDTGSDTSITVLADASWFSIEAV